jgi:hypothetical protein
LPQYPHSDSAVMIGGTALCRAYLNLARTLPHAEIRTLTDECAGLSGQVWKRSLTQSHLTTVRSVPQLR